MQIEFYINGNLVQPPENVKELQVEINYDSDIPKAQLSTNKWRFVRDNAEIINKHITDGLINGVGIFEGLPLQIKLIHFGNAQTLLDGYIDLSEPTELSCDDITIVSKPRKSIDWLNDIADGFSFEYLFENGKITSSQFKNVPYIINTVPNYREAFMALVTVVIVGREAINNVRAFISDVVHCVNPFEITFVVTIVFRVIYFIAIVTVMINLVTDFIKNVIRPVGLHAGMYVKDLFTVGASHLGLGFQSTIFLSGAEFEKLFLIPEKYQLKPTDELVPSVNFVNQSISNQAISTQGTAQTPLNAQAATVLNIKNVNITYSGADSLQRGFFKGTFGDFIRAFKILFNAKVVIKNNTLIFERRDFNTSSTLYQIPDIRNDFYSLNVDELKSNYLLQFETDINDKNTIDQYTGTIYQITTRPITVVNSDIVLMRNLERVQFPFSLAKMKTKLSFPEQSMLSMIAMVNNVTDLYSKIINVYISFLNKIITLINNIINAFDIINDIIDFVNTLPGANIPNVNINFANAIPQVPSVQIGHINNPLGDRMGMMLLENDYIDSPKLLLINENSDPKKTKISSSNSSVVSAKNIWDKFHSINSFAEVSGKHNQWYEYELDSVPFTFDDYLKVKDDNKCLDPDGSSAEILNLQWFPYLRKAKIKYRVNKKYTNNLQLITTQGDGN